MSLRLKRNLPTLALLAAFLLAAGVLIGNQPVIAYIVNAENPSSQQTGSLTSVSLAAASAAEALPIDWNGPESGLADKGNFLPLGR